MQQGKSWISNGCFHGNHEVALPEQILLITIHYSSCFQIIGKEPLDVKKMETLLNDPKNKELKRVFIKYNIENVERCASVSSKAETSWVQIWVLIISSLIGVASFIASCTICCMHRR